MNDTIIFTVEIVVYGEVEHQNTYATHGFTLDQDIYTLFHKSVNTDLIIKAVGKRFHVHKCILGARSPVFQAMFSKLLFVHVYSYLFIYHCTKRLPNYRNAKRSNIVGRR